MTANSADEVWLPVVGYAGLYEASSLGQVRSLYRAGTRGRVLRQHVSKSTGYLYVVLYRDARRSQQNVHTLVAGAFLGPRPEGRETRHGPGGRLENAITNLGYGTQSQNSGEDRRRDGTLPCGEQNGNAKLTADIVREIRRDAASTTYVSQAREYGVNPSTIAAIVRGHSWRHLLEADASMHATVDEAVQSLLAGAR